MAAVGGSGVTGMGMIVPLALPVGANPIESGQADRELIVGGRWEISGPRYE